MTRLKRITNKIFGNTASTTGSPDTGAEIGQFGSAKAGTYNATADVETIQALPAYEQGWIGAVIPDQQYPTLPEMTGVNKVLSYQTGYLMQEGIPEWDSGTTYYKNSIVKYAKVTTTQTTTVSIGASTGITSASVNKNTFVSQISVDGNYTFTYNGTSWLYNGIATDLNIYGITYTGTPAENDTITVTLTTTTSIGDLTLYISLTDDNINHNPLTDIEHWKEFGLGGGSGLEICDIGMALYVDETKGLRRYLNGQIVDINTNTQAFLNRLQQITTLHPSLLCTEEEWQSAKTMSAFGQVGKFVFNYSGDEIVSVRLPRVVNVQGLFDLQNLGMTVGAGLPTLTTNSTGAHTHTRGTMNITGQLATLTDLGFNTSGAFGYFTHSIGNNGIDTAGNASGYVDFVASRSWTGETSSNGAHTHTIEGTSNTVQQEAIQYPYFIQVATGSETENNIINDIELNNPYSLFDSKYSDHELNNLSWLKSEGQWNSKAAYPTAYDKLLKVYNGTETVEGLSVVKQNVSYKWITVLPDSTYSVWTKRRNVKVGDIVFGYNPRVIVGYIQSVNGDNITCTNSIDSTQTSFNFKGINTYDVVDDYDFVLNTAEETFRLPIKTKLASGKAVVGNGKALMLTNGTQTGALSACGSSATGNVGGFLRPVNGVDGINIGDTAKTTVGTQFDTDKAIGIVTDPTKSGIETDTTGLYLYFYVGETVQNANLIDAGRIGEVLATKTDMLQASGAGMPSNRYIDLTLGASGSTYTVPANGWLVLNATANNASNFIQLENQTSLITSSDYGTTKTTPLKTYLPVRSLDVINITYAHISTTNVTFRFIYAEGENS